MLGVSEGAGATTAEVRAYKFKILGSARTSQVQARSKSLTQRTRPRYTGRVLEQHPESGRGGSRRGIFVRERWIVLLDLMLQERVLSLPASVRYHTGPLHGFQFIDITQQQRTPIRNYCETMAS